VTGPTDTALADVGFPVNGAVVPIDSITDLRWQTVQSSAAAQYDVYATPSTDGTLITNLAGGNTTSGTPVIIIEPGTIQDLARTAMLYFDVFIGTSAANLQQVAHTEGAEWGERSVGEAYVPPPVSVWNVAISDVLAGLGISQLKVGTTYYWQIRAKDSLDNKFSTGVLSFVVGPPNVNWSTFALSYDLDGYYFEWEVKPATGVATDTAICDLIVSTSSTFNASSTAVATNLDDDAAEIGGNYFKVYVSDISGFTLAADTNYYAKVVVKDKVATGTTIRTEGLEWKIKTPITLETDQIYWNITATDNATPASATVLYPLPLGTSSAIQVPFKANILTWTYTPYYSYKLYMGTANPPTAADWKADISASANGTLKSYTFSGVAFGTTYYVRIDATNTSDPSITHSSPVVQLKTASYTGGQAIDFDVYTLSLH
jgi:hypothetical protein